MLAANFETTSDLMTFEKMPLIKPDSGVTLSEKMFCRVICLYAAFMFARNTFPNHFTDLAKENEMKRK